jgi:hypothetical protein
VVAQGLETLGYTDKDGQKKYRTDWDGQRSLFAWAGGTAAGPLFKGLQEKLPARLTNVGSTGWFQQLADVGRNVNARTRSIAPEVTDNEVIDAIMSIPVHHAKKVAWSKGDQLEFFASDRYTPNADLLQPGALRSAAVEAHNLLHPIGREHTTVALAEVHLPEGPIQIWGAGSNGALTPAQRALLGGQGVRLFSGNKHAELNIIDNLPPGATIQRWGISWGVGRSGDRSWNIPCGECAPRVTQVPGPGHFE